MTTKRRTSIDRRDFIKCAFAAGAGFAVACRMKRAVGSSKHLIDFNGSGPEGLEVARREGASGVITPIKVDSTEAYIKTFKASARRLGLEPEFWVEIGRDEEGAALHTEWLHVPQHTDWLAQFPSWAGKKAAVFPWLPLNNREVFDYQVAKVVTIAAKLEAGDSIYLNDVQNPPAGCGCGNLQCRSWDNSIGEKIASSPYDHPESFFTAIFMAELRSRASSINLTPIICPECEQGVRMGDVENPDARTGYCNSINCSDPCGGFYYPGLVRSLGGLQQVGLLCTYKALRRDIPLYGETASWVAANIERYTEHGDRTKLLPVLQGWDVSEDEVRAQVDFANRAKVRGYILSRLPLHSTFQPVAVNS